MFRKLSVFAVFFVCAFSASLPAQVSTSSSPVLQPSAVTQALHAGAWEYGPFFTGGVGTSDRSDYSFLNAGLHAGRLIGTPFGPGILHGQFEMAADLMPWWQGRTPSYLRANTTVVDGKSVFSSLYRTGGAYNGVSVTPVIFRWNLVSRRDVPSRRLLPFLQGAGGLIWTNHKYPPVGPYQQPNKNGASVWNFTPQFGIGMHYFLKPKQAITFQANAVHISSASLGDTNPGVNASVQFTVGYTWWK